MRTVIFGGSFNPPHAGHISAALSAARELEPDRFLIMPDYEAPHKKMADGSPEPIQRLELCRIAFGGIPGVEISDLEINRGGRSYTIDTLTDLHEMYPEDEFSLIIGSDMLLSFDKCWYRFEDILKLCSLAVCSREGNDLEALEEHSDYLRREYGADIRILLSHEAVVESSTEIRRLLAEGQHPPSLPDEVWNYIRKNRLYGAR